MPRKPTALDVAQAANVSLSTVDRVLNNRGGVAKHKEMRVLSAARRLRLDRALDPRAARTLRVAVLIQPPANPFHALLRKAVEAENSGPNPFNMQLRVFYIEPTQPALIARRIREVSLDHDALMVCITHDPVVTTAIESVISLGKPVITLATGIDTIAEHIYVGPDNKQAGRIAGDLMGRYIGPNGGEILVVLGLLSMAGQAERAAGFKAVITARYPACSVVSVLESREDGERAGALTASTLKARPNLRGVYNTSAGALPVADAILRAGRTGAVTFVTHELTPQRRELLKSGRIDALIDQDPAFEIQTAVRALAAHFERLGIGPATTLTPLRIHTIETC